MNTTELLGLFREEVADAELPYLWSDASVYRYIDDAQKQFCRWTYGIADARSFKLFIKPGTEWYPVDPRVLKVRSAANAVTGREVPLVALEKLDEHGIRFDKAPGHVAALISGMQENTLRAWPVPNVAAVVELRTFRLPETVEAGSEFEIGEQHHLNLLLWVKHRAYGIQDSEGSDKNKAADYEARFARYCAAAKLEQGRLYRPVSTVRYGGL